MRISDWSSDVCSSDLRLRCSSVVSVSGNALVLEPAHGVGEVHVDDSATHATVRVIEAEGGRGVVGERGEVLHPGHQTLRSGRQEVGERSQVAQGLAQDRKRVGEGKRVSVRLGLWGRRVIQNKHTQHTEYKIRRY